MQLIFTLYSYNGVSAYGQSKLANILHASELARQLKVRDMFVDPLSLISFFYLSAPKIGALLLFKD